MTAPGVVCSRCGQTADGRPLDWTVERDDGGQRWLCATCTHSHVRDIEARLDTSWWTPDSH